MEGKMEEVDGNGTAYLLPARSVLSEKVGEQRPEEVAGNKERRSVLCSVASKSAVKVN